MFSKATENAIAAMALLAEVYDCGETLLTAREIADRRELPQPFIAKLLTQLALAELVTAVPGRHGGYHLTRPPAEIHLADIANCFERRERRLMCPFGKKYCDNGRDCPIHDQVTELTAQVEDFLTRNSLAQFAVPTKE